MLRLVLSTLMVAWLAAAVTAAEPLAEKYLVEGRLGDGVKALESHLAKKPEDDEARFGLGVVRFFQAIEHLGANLHKYGLRTERAFARPARQIQELLPQNGNPETLSYAAFRQILQTWVDDISRAEAELARVKNPGVKLPLHVARIKVDIFGQGEPMSAAGLLDRLGLSGAKSAEELAVAFDRGDVSWLRGYLHVLAAWGELFLAIDGQEMFDCTAHLFFEKVQSPHDFLQDDARTWDEFNIWNNRGIFTDIIAWFHTMRFPIKDPARMQAVLTHLEATVTLGKEMWTHILAETDDDREWIPNPRQKQGVMQIAVTDEMVATWKSTLDETDLILKGKKLIPFWRGTGQKGVNLRRVFTEPRMIDPFLWFQGTAATPYLETGPITSFANEEMWTRINRTFGPNFPGFAFWFN